jgi:hypothetical protein
MPRDPKEFGNKLTGYAAAIVAFAFVQGVTFSFALGSDDTFLKHAVRVWWLITPLGADLPSWGEDALFDPAASSVAPWERKMRIWRFVVIALGLIVLLVACGASFYGYYHDSETANHATR